MAKQQTQNRRPSKIRPVPINKMRVPTELVAQRKFRQAHGDKLAKELDLNKLGFPIINQRDGHYWVLDGQHRIYALRENGFKDELLDCEVYENLSDAEMAEIFLGRDDRRAIQPFDKFHVACTAGRRRECDIRRIVEGNGLKISLTKGDNVISAVSSLGRVYDRSGDVVLGQVLRVLKNAFAGDSSAFDGQLIVGVGLVFDRYNGRTNEKELTARLSAVTGGTKGLLRRAESLRERTGNDKAQCIAATVVDVYNRGTAGRSKERLADWWKDAA